MGDIILWRSMINFFGVGGVYVNLIIEEYISLDFYQNCNSFEEYIFFVLVKMKWSFEVYFDRLVVFLEKMLFFYLVVVVFVL